MDRRSRRRTPTRKARTPRVASRRDWFPMHGCEIRRRRWGRVTRPDRPWRRPSVRLGLRRVLVATASGLPDVACDLLGVSCRFMEGQGRWRCVRATVFGLSQASDPFDHVISGELLEVGSISSDLSLDRRSVAIDCIGQASLSVSPRRQGGLDCLSSRQIRPPSLEGLGSETLDRCQRYGVGRRFIRNDGSIQAVVMTDRHAFRALKSTASRGGQGRLW